MSKHSEQTSRQRNLSKHWDREIWANAETEKSEQTLRQKNLSKHWDREIWANTETEKSEQTLRQEKSEQTLRRRNLSKHWDREIWANTETEKSEQTLSKQISQISPSQYYIKIFYRVCFKAFQWLEHKTCQCRTFVHKYDLELLQDFGEVLEIYLAYKINLFGCYMTSANTNTVVTQVYLHKYRRHLT